MVSVLTRSPKFSASSSLSIKAISKSGSTTSRTYLYNNHTAGSIRYISSSTRGTFRMPIITEAPKASSSNMPIWVPPKPLTEEPVLKVYNSLTRNKDVFTPRRGKQVDWYNCGPTVYDSSHMGHARNYLTQDIIRRILRDYFGYDVNFVMNVTDIDDKIILRAREQHLLEQTITSTPRLTPQLLETTTKAFERFLTSKLFKSFSPIPDIEDDPIRQFDEIQGKDKTDTEWAKGMREKDEKFGMYMTSLGKAGEAIKIARGRLSGQGGDDAVKELVEGSAEVLGPYLGETLADTISDPISVSRKLAAHWEDQFFMDMSRLNILPPDTTTRVSEYVPEIVSYVQKIIDNGYAYEGEGSVWFDVTKFEGAQGTESEAEGEEGKESPAWKHEYAKLQPGSKGNRKLLDEGEGALTGSRGKRQASDFALWKAKSKPGEPAWPSPWGEGRPGWHIECSVMASEILGKGMDIHSGGVDLMFPHHDNELAQSEAYHGCRQWVNYFLHTGHLHIEGLKMSKSLKNFITIDEALRDYSARQLRLAFMLQSWDSKMDFRKDLLADVKAKEGVFDSFFLNVKARIAQAGTGGPSGNGSHGYNDAEKILMEEYHTAQADFHVALCDSFNTAKALSILLALIGKVNIYSRPKGYNAGVLEVIADWITRMLNMFGLGEGSGSFTVGWGKAGEDVSNGVNYEETIDPFVKGWSSFRDEVRKLAMGGGSSAELLALCDRARNQDFVNLGVQLDDNMAADGGALYKFVDPSILKRQREEREQQELAKEANKARTAARLREEREARLEKGKIAPGEMFKPPNVAEGLYAQWDEVGIPIKLGDGGEVSKSQGKKWAKEMKGQEKLHAEWLKEVGKDGKA